MAKKAKISGKYKNFIAEHTMKGNQVLFTNNGYPYAIVKADKAKGQKPN